MTFIHSLPKLTVVVLILGSSACDMIPVKVNSNPLAGSVARFACA